MGDVSVQERCVAACAHWIQVSGRSDQGTRCVDATSVLLFMCAF